MVAEKVDWFRVAVVVVVLQGREKDGVCVCGVGGGWGGVYSIE
jgi:hypothetical protein